MKRRFKKTLQPCHLVVSFGLNSVSMLKLEQLLLVFYFFINPVYAKCSPNQDNNANNATKFLFRGICSGDVAVAGFVLLPLQSHQHAL